MPQPAIKILPRAQALINDLRPASASAKSIVEQMIEKAAAVDGDRVLDEFEAEALQAATWAVAPSGPITTEQAVEINSALDVRLAALQAARPNATAVLFTSQGAALTKFRNAIIGTMKETIAKADGKQVDINMMVFSFTDTKMADQILKLAEQHPNTNFRLLTDWSQLATSGSRQARRITRLARQRGLDNVQVKFKKDNPYIWDDKKKRPTYNHGSTTGLNHHKGFVTLIDGRPEKMVVGSFNWSLSAMKTSYENLMVLDRADADNRAIMDGYESEFEAFWNNGDVALTETQARQYKDEIYAALYAANGEEYTSYNIPTYTYDDDAFEAENVSPNFDINSFADSDTARLESLVGKRRAKKIQRELAKYGRFDTWTELLIRVPDVASASLWAREQLRENLEYGNGGSSINTATVSELDRAGLSKRTAARVVAFREEHGAFESLEELDAVRGIGLRTIENVRLSMTADENVGVYSGRVPGGPAMTGFSPDNHGTISVPRHGLDTPSDDLIPSNRDDQQAVDRNLAAVVIDMLRRTEPGQTFRMAMYGCSTSSSEYKELEAAIKRGVGVRVVIYNSYNGKAIAALKALQDAGYDVDLRVIKSRVMHEKFGVVGDDVFNGSSNWSSSSINKHAEDRFLFRNMPSLAARFVEEFARLWQKGKAV